MADGCSPPQSDLAENLWKRLDADMWAILAKSPKPAPPAPMKEDERQSHD